MATYIKVNNTEYPAEINGNPKDRAWGDRDTKTIALTMTAAEVAEILRVSTKTVYKLIKEKSLPAVKVGRENRIAKSQLIDYLRQRETSSSNPKICFLEKTPEKVWTCAVSCDIVRVGKNKKGVNANECRNHICSQRTG